MSPILVSLHYNLYIALTTVAAKDLPHANACCDTGSHPKDPPILGELSLYILDVFSKFDTALLAAKSIYCLDPSYTEPHLMMIYVGDKHNEVIKHFPIMCCDYLRHI
jgi:hypothetical protein